MYTVQWSGLELSACIGFTSAPISQTQTIAGNHNRFNPMDTEALSFLSLNSSTLPVSRNYRTSLYGLSALFFLTFLAGVWSPFSVVILILSRYHTWLWTCLPAFSIFLVLSFLESIQLLSWRCTHYICRLPLWVPQSSVSWLSSVLPRRRSGARCTFDRIISQEFWIWTVRRWTDAWCVLGVESLRIFFIICHCWC